MKVGIPKEIKKHEYRVGLTPGSAREFTARGHTVLVEKGAGAGIGASDDDYRQHGASIVESAEKVWEAADLVIKVKEPQPSEWIRLRPDQILFTYLHLAADPAQAKGLQDSRCVAVAYETVTDVNGGLPLLAPMSEVAGRLSIEAAGAAMKRYAGGKGLLLGGVPGVRPARVLILGGGVVGLQAARMAVGLGADVTILDRSVPRLRYLDDVFQGRIKTRISTISSVEEEIAESDVVVGAVLVAGASAPKLITRPMLSRMRPGTVLVDVAIDQGGCAETSRPTTHDSPTYEVDGVVHYCVANMPGAVPRTSSQALNNATLPFGLELADQGVRALLTNANLLAGLNVCNGHITSRAVSESLGSPYMKPEDALRSGALFT